jgi:DNA-binding IclR family transcriptional regulator
MVIECISKGKEKNLSTISQETGIPLSTCSRITNQLLAKGLVQVVNTAKTDEKAVLFTLRGFDFAVVHYGIDAQKYVNQNPRFASRTFTDIINLVSDESEKRHIWYAMCKYRRDNDIYERPLNMVDTNKIAAIAAIELSSRVDETTAKRIGSTHTREVAKYLNAHQRAIDNARRSLGIS